MKQLVKPGGMKPTGGQEDDRRRPAPAVARAAANAYGRNAALPAPPAQPDPQTPADPMDAPELMDREFLITECLPLVKFIAHRISSRLPSHVEVDDLIHSGILGLMDAIKKFEPGRNVKFKTYAEQRI